jgi:hypothetical protein
MNGPATTREEFWGILRAPSDTLSLVIKAHHSIEARLHEALEERLPRADRIELRRVGFLLKVDFLIALGVLSPQMRHIFELVNVIRNRFAHDPYASFTEDDATKVKSAVRSIDKKYPCSGDASEILLLLLHVVFDYSTRRFEEIVIERLRSQALQEMMTDRSWQEPHPSGIELPPITEEMLKEVHDEMEPEIVKRVTKKLSEQHPMIRLKP